MPQHFGINVREGKRGLRLTRDNYAVISKKRSLMVFPSITYDNNEEQTYTDEWCATHFKNCMDNFDLNMEYFSRLDRDKFNSAINSFLKKNRNFSPVTDLNEFSGKPGYYIMVLDDYCQVYIGTTDDIRCRIPAHWSKAKPFDRLLYPIGAVTTSLLSIDSFRAYDTTRILANVASRTYDNEDLYINQFPAEFVCNRRSGGRLPENLLEIIRSIKQRQLQ